MNGMSIKLWIQGTEKTGSSMSVNGKLVDGRDPMYDRYYGDVCRDAGMKCSYRDEWGKVFYSKDNKDFSFLFKAHYNELDEVGRRIVFMSRIDGVATIQDAITMLERESKDCGYTLNEKEMVTIANAFSNRHKTKVVTIIALAMLCIAYTLYRATIK